jgi:DNA-binding HxlR family transcriptional regulator
MPTKLSAKEVLLDLRLGLSDTQLKEKYNLSDKGLSSLLTKMHAAGLITEAEMQRRPGSSKPSSQPSDPPKSTGTVPKAAAAPSAADASQDPLTAAVAEDIRNGLHNNEIMSRNGLSPNQLKSLLNELAAAGLIGQDEAAIRQGAKAVTCPSCGGKTLDSAKICGQCGASMRSDNHGAQGHPGAQYDTALPPIPPIDTSTSFDYECPWEQRESYGVWNAYLQTASNSLFRPAEFFSRLPPEGGFVNPILFAIFSVAVSASIGVLFLSIFRKTGITAGFFGIIIGFGCTFISASMFVPVGLAIWSGLVHGALLIVGGAKQGFETTFRVVGYSNAPQLLSVIPVVGSVAATVYSLILLAIGLRETHEIPTGKSALAVGIAVGIAALLGLLLYFLTMMYIAAKMKGAMPPGMH